VLPILRRLPRRLDRLADAVEHGRRNVTVRLLADRRDRRPVTRPVHQGLLTVLGAVAGVMAVLFLCMPEGLQVTPTPSGCSRCPGTDCPSSPSSWSCGPWSSSSGRTARENRQGAGVRD
jgi:hypothetical protein